MNAVPFRIQDYTQSAAQIEATAERLTEFLGMLDRTISPSNLAQFSARVDPVVQQAQAGGKEVVDYAFRKGILLVVVVLVAALIYRFLVTRGVNSRSKQRAPVQSGRTLFEADIVQCLFHRLAGDAYDPPERLVQI